MVPLPCGTDRSSSRASRRSRTRALAVEHGVEAIALSNHGGRQLDSAPAIAELVAPVADAVADGVEIICDGGVRRGSDIVKAVSLGARACMVGRAYLYGLGAAGERGVDHALGLLRRRRPPDDGPRGCVGRDRPRPGAGQPSRLTALASATARSIEAITVGPGAPSAKSSPVAYTTVGTVHPARLATRARPLVSNER